MVAGVLWSLLFCGHCCAVVGGGVGGSCRAVVWCGAVADSVAVAVLVRVLVAGASVAVLDLLLCGAVAARVAVALLVLLSDLSDATVAALAGLVGWLW